MSDNYTEIPQPYTNYLDRDLPGTTPDNGSLNTQPVRTGGNLGDIWVDTFIRSTNWSPKKIGFYIDGLKGYAEFMNVFISGDIHALTGTIGGFTIGATNLSVTAGGNTVTISSGATAFLAGPTGSPTITITQAGLLTVSNISITGGSININNNAVIDSNGYATFIGVSSLNKKAYTNFETAGRFVGTSGGSGSNVFGNQGVTIAPGATGTSFSYLQWKVGNVMSNNPTFTCTILAFNLVAASGDSRCFVGLGSPSVTGSGINYSTINHIGFTINKSSGSVDVGGQNGDNSGVVGANFTTIVDTDVLELFIKVTATSIAYYYRKNGGSITLGTTQTTHIPTATGEDSMSFQTSNAGSAFDFQLVLQCAAYEH